MNKQETREFLNSIAVSLERKRGKEAFDCLNTLLSNIQNWQLKEELCSLEDTYKTMLRYIANGIQDPEQEKIHTDLARSIYWIADKAILKIRTTNDNSLFYELKRIYGLNIKETTEELISELEEIAGKIALQSLLEEEERSNSIKESNARKEIAVRKLFYNVWTSDHWTNEDQSLWAKILKIHQDSDILLCLIITGLTLNLLETFDEKKANLLFEAALNPNEEVRERALTGIVLFLRQYDYRLYLYPRIVEQLNQLAEDPSFIRKISHILLQFILSRETEKITQQITTKLIPEMLKKWDSKSDIKLKLDDMLAETGMEEKNPEWQNIIESSGLEEKFRELTELQMEGADVMHSSFIHLKNYPFFNEPSNWFKLFSISDSNIDDPEMTQLAEILATSTLLCNSDKYSLYLSISKMPNKYRKVMIKHLSAETESMKEALKKDISDTPKTVDYRTRQYIQDLYRFYKLHPRRKDFEDIFEALPEFYKVPSINQLIRDNENLSIIGEYYFNKNYFEEANDIFDMLLLKDVNNDVLYQKKGYCLQMTGRLEQALDSYQKAELLNSNHSWTIKRLAHLYRLMKHPKEALQYYKKAEQLNPDNLSVQSSIGHCYLELKDYEKALKYYFKVEYLTNNKEKSWRPIAWTSFLIGKYRQAANYYNKLIDGNSDFMDYLNAGHVQLALRHTKEAIHFYYSSWEKSKLSQADFRDIFAEDIPNLIAAGVHTENIPFILDCVFYSENI